jgi:hypothetical protein
MIEIHPAYSNTACLSFFVEKSRPDLGKKCPCPVMRILFCSPVHSKTPSHMHAVC